MTLKDKVSQLLDKAFEERKDLFLIDFSVNDANKISVTIDGDNGVTLQDCIDVSRAVEHNLDREELDFSLDVASAGVGSPLKNNRQFARNVGRTLKVKVGDEVVEAELSAISETAITLEWQSREPKKIGKGKETVTHQREIPFGEIKEAIVTIKF